MEHYVYVLKSLKFARHYIRLTSDVANRFEVHNAGRVRSTKAFKPWLLIYSEKFQDKTSARKREIHLKKNFRARKDLFDEIKNGPIV